MGLSFPHEFGASDSETLRRFLLMTSVPTEKLEGHESLVAPWHTHDQTSRERLLQHGELGGYHLYPGSTLQEPLIIH